MKQVLAPSASPVIHSLLISQRYVNHFTSGGQVLFALAAFVLLMVSSRSFAADVVTFQATGADRFDEQQLRRSFAFYGLHAVTADVRSRTAVRDSIARLRDSRTVAVLIAQDALPMIDREQFLAALHRPENKSIPVLVYGIQAGEDGSALKTWSGGAIRRCTAAAQDIRPDVLQVGNRCRVARTLAGLQLPAVTYPTCHMEFETTSAPEIVLSSGANGNFSAVLVRLRTAGSEFFFAPEMTPFDSSWMGNPLALAKAFSSLAPFFMFLSYAAGDYAWHTEAHYANLTIDDPWLTEPYGRLEYKSLLRQMEQHNFHTTIAFIPWNFDRSEPEVVDLFRAHRDRFSVCIHGNDHTHREFGPYSRSPLAKQIANIQQAVARMERFHVLTGIPVDRFMVFPQGVAPEGTFAALKQYGFLGTANSLNVPLGSAFPCNPVFGLRPYTLDYADLLSLSRYPARDRIPRLEIAIHAFLGNPLLFYGHEQLFESGAGAFNDLADFINQVQPDVQWTSLGEIARHLYLIRRQSETEFNVRMLSNELVLQNPAPYETEFHIERQESVSPGLTVTVDNVPADAERNEQGLSLRLVIPPKQTRTVRLVYANDLDLSRQQISKSSLYALFLRRSSDLRDLYLSRTSLGRAIRVAYYRNRWDVLELRVEKAWRVLAGFIGLNAAAAWYQRRRIRKIRGRAAYDETRCAH